MKAARNRLTHTIFVMPVLIILFSTFCLCLTPAASAMSVGMSCDLMEDGSRLSEDHGELTCVKAAKISIGDLTAPPKLTYTGKLLPQVFTAQVSSLNFDPHPRFAPVLSSTSHRSYPSIEIFTLNATYRL